MPRIPRPTLRMQSRRACSMIPVLSLRFQRQKIFNAMQAWSALQIRIASTAIRFSNTKAVVPPVREMEATTVNLQTAHHSKGCAAHPTLRQLSQRFAHHAPAALPTSIKRANVQDRPQRARVEEVSTRPELDLHYLVN